MPHLQGIHPIRLTIAATGTVTIPTGHPFTDVTGRDYEVVVVEGLGSVDPGTKTQDDFDFTVVDGPCVVLILTDGAGDKAHVN